MYEFYMIPESLYCAKTRILLRYKQLEWKEILPLGGYGSAEYKTIIPSGNLPAMIDGDFFISDSEAIAEYLEEKNPNPSCLSKNIQTNAKIRELSRFNDSRLEPKLRQLFKIFDGHSIHRDFILDVSDEIDQLLKQLNEMLAIYEPYRPDHITFADCGFAITFSWIEELNNYLNMNIVYPENVSKYYLSIKSYDPIIEELTHYKPILTRFLKDIFSS
ncbi:glutathione S-transferase family protein [Curvivirga aplysinae]|uniref:glutathione S-transferase family protein n=1 Tax=Curvivirga aplysinae TaxID=2529852 RepID=UPI0012BC953E|nr:glutathione S-transferase family protein [Curvivirga aplysinae]MTI10024.1 glutathione S-transferase family protein [Curvivirga aplysinae]